MTTCVSCGKSADVEIETIVHPLTARGEQMFEMMRKVPNIVPMCIDCTKRAGAAVERGDFAEEEP